MWRYSALKGGGGTPTPTPVPTRETRAFGSFGLSAATVVVTPGNAVAGGPADLTAGGVTSQALDGLLLAFTHGQGRTYWFNILINDVLVVDHFPLNFTVTNGTGVRRIPLTIPAGATVKIAMATTAGATTISVLPFGYTSNLPSNISAVSIPSGSAVATPNSQGAVVNLTGTTWTAWTPIGTSALAAAAKGLATIHFWAANSTTGRTAVTDIYYEVGYGPDAASVTSISPTFGATSTTNNIFSQDGEPIWSDIPAGNFLFFRAKAGVADTDPVNCQVAVMS